MTISTKWCPACKIAWQTTRKTCYFCSYRFADADEYTITKGVATRKQPEGGTHATDTRQPTLQGLRLGA